MRGKLVLSIVALFASNLLCALSFSPWEIVYQKEGAVINQIDFYDEYFAIAVGDDGLVLITKDGGETWEDYSDPSMGDLKKIEVVTDELFFCATSSKVFRSEDLVKGWTKVFDRPSISINGVFWSFGGVVDRVHICADNAILFSSLDGGFNWFPIDVSNFVRSDDDILYCIAGEVDEIKDTLYRIVARDRGYFRSLDNLRTIDAEQDPSGSIPVKTIHAPLDFNVSKRYGDLTYTGLNNEVWIQDSKSSKRPASWYSINDCIYVRYLAGDDWYGFAVGDSGRIEEVATNGFGIPKQITSPTTKDLNWIDWGADPETESLFGVATFCAVGDGVILRKRWGWEPVSAPRIANDVRTNLYPNPSQEYFKIESKGWAGGELVTVRLYSLSGVLVKKIYHGVPENGDLSVEVNEALESGIYVVELSSNTKRVVKRLIRN